MAETAGTYTVLARRYRPQTFDTVVGQQHVAQALRNAIRAERVAHAYLFTGARGVGKTSMARILAKALNCPNSEYGNPCNKCDLCQAISTGSDVDVMEIDGASNRGIDDIRSLRANVGIRSMRTRIKMYIIDEVHMLTKEAFNALLKTLEEPPPNVKFVFCTTEPQKVPDTILSRCQRFDFSSIDTQRIAERLADIARQEGIEVSAEAIDLVARRAGGSMRDSQSLFDQLLAFGGERIDARDVNALLGTADDERLLKIIQFAHNKQQAELLAEIDQAGRDGVQLGNLLDQLVNCYRDLMVLRCGATSLETIGIGSSARPAMEQMVQHLGLQTISAAMQILSEAKTKLSRVSHGRALVDLALIRISLLGNLDDIQQLIADLKEGQFTATIPSTGRVTAPPPIRLTTSVASAPSPAIQPAAPSNLQAPQAQAAPEPPPFQQSTRQSTQQSSSYQNAAPEMAEAESVSRSEADSLSSASAFPPELPASQVKSGVESINFEEGNRQKVWSQLLSVIDDAILTHLKTVQRTAISAPNQLDIFIPSQYSFAKGYFENKPDQVRKIEARLREITARAIQVRFLLEESTPKAGQQKGSSSTGSSSQPMGTKPAFVQAAEVIFSATVAKAERIRKASE